MRLFLLAILFSPLGLPAALSAQPFSPAEIQGWKNQAARVTIIRDEWGIPHIYGKSDADAVFGLMYAQCEDDFKRVEMNYIEKLGRRSEVKGPSMLYEDLLIRLVIDSTGAMDDYNKAPEWLQKLMNAWADGINYYLYQHPEVKPALLHRFQPWYPLLWTDGSIGAISTADITVDELAAFYGGDGRRGAADPKEDWEEDPTGSNGFAFAPSATASGKSILYINPHVTFYFRPEVHVVSEEGLNVYGAVTWGQFFVYQGFNEKCGWMHTSSYTDISDTYIEKINRRGEQMTYSYEGKERPVTKKMIALRYLENGVLKSKNIETYHTHHGPIMAARKGQWLSMKAVNRSMDGLVQSWQRNKTKGFADFKKTIDLRANASNNTVYADAEGNIAYWHGNFIPKRDLRYDWSRPVDGSIASTEWQGLHPVEETVHIINPPNGRLQNCNSTPFTAAGKNSPAKENYPTYMAPDEENYRGINAVRVLSESQNVDLDKAIAAGYDTKLSAFEVLIPALVRAFEQARAEGGARFNALAAPIELLKNWDYRCGENSVPTALAVEWGERVMPAIHQMKLTDDPEADLLVKVDQFCANAPAEQFLEPLLSVLDQFKKSFGRWQVEWGEINRLQRISTRLEPTFSDNQPSIPVAYASAVWGMLPSYKAEYFPGTKRRYGVNGNSFVCAVEFGEKVKAKSLLAGGQSGDEKSPHFSDQLENYAKGRFKEVHFYKEDVVRNAKRSYRPGE